MTRCTTLQERFTQTDPTPYGAGTAFESAYVYAGTRPTVMTDPGGKRFGLAGEIATPRNGVINPILVQSTGIRIPGVGCLGTCKKKKPKTAVGTSLQSLSELKSAFTGVVAVLVYGSAGVGSTTAVREANSKVFSNWDYPSPVEKVCGHVLRKPTSVSIAGPLPVCSNIPAIDLPFV